MKLQSLALMGYPCRQNFWGSFTRTGAPYDSSLELSWDPWTADRGNTMVFDITNISEVDHLKESDCAALQAINSSFWATG